MSKEELIQDVSDTALWVAYYRGKESQSKKPLFYDPLAVKLAGEKGKKIAKSMPQSTEWVIVVRTIIIDQMIKDAIAAGVDVVLNLGTGLDTRPYRMDLPPELQWIEVDYPHLIEYKEKVLQGEVPRCRLERVKMDLAQESLREKLFTDINAKAKKALVITEGVTPYLTNEQVASLAQALLRQSHFQLWVLDYMTEFARAFLVKRLFKGKLKNAPFVFNPGNWNLFYEKNGWKMKTVSYVPEEAIRLKRMMRPPLLMIFAGLFMSRKKKAMFRTMSGYAVLEPMK